MHTFTHMLASVLVLLGLAGKALAQSTFDANGDGTADSVAFIGDTIEVRSGVDSSLLYSIAGTSGEGFGASYLLNRDLNGDGIFDFAVAAPNAQGPDGAVGRVLAYSGATGTALWSASPAAQASLGSTLIAVADQDYDGVPDLIVSAGSPPVRSALVSGATGALVRSSDHTPAAIEALVSAGVRVFAASDLDGSGTVDATDALLFATAYSAADLDADLNGDGLLDASDVGLLADELATGVTTIDAFTADPNFGQPQPTSGGTPPAGCGCTQESSWRPIAQGSNPPPTFYDCVESSPNILWIDPPSGQPADSLTIGVVHPRPGCVLLTDESCAEVIAGPEGATQDVSVSADGITFGTDTNGAYTVRVRIVYQCGDMICAMCRTFSFGVNVAPPLSDPTNCAPLVCIEGPGIQYEPQECEPLWLGDVPQMSSNARWVPFGETIWIAVRVLPEEDAGVIWTWGARAGCEGLVLETEEVIRGEGIFLLRVTTPPAPPTTCDHPYEFWIIAEGGNEGCSTTRSVGCLIRLGADGDGDGIVDEGEEDMQDGGNCPDPENPDSDSDGFGDGTEVRLGSDPCDPESVPDITGDTDHDGVTDFEEVEFYRTNPLHADSDDDGADDYGEIRIARALPELGMDPNQPLSVTRAAGVSNLADGAVAAYVAHDADRDGIFDELEIKRGWLATNPDQDFDGIRDGLELRHGMDPEQADQGPASPAAWIDFDGDGLTDAVERRLGTSRTSSDSDGDGMTDGWEAALGYDPTRSDSDRNGTPDGDEDFDGDGISNRDELAAGTHLAVADTDGDGLCDSRDKNPTGRLRLPALDANGVPCTSGSPELLVGIPCLPSPDIEASGTIGPHSFVQRPCRTTYTTWEYYRYPISYGERIVYRWVTNTSCFSPPGLCIGRFDCEAPCSDFVSGVPYGGTPELPYWVCDSGVDPQGNCEGGVFEREICVGWPFGLDESAAGDSDGDGIRDTWDGNPLDGQFDPSTIPTAVDLDIDSDNNDGLDEPAGTPAEEGLEDQPGHPGKIILADTWDSDGDNIPDNVDGLQGSSPPVDRFTTTGLDLSRGNVQFVPMVLKVRGYFPNLDDPTAPPSVRFSYSFSDPSIPIVAGEDPFAVAPGNFRLWAKRRSVVRPPMLPGANNPFGADSMFPATPGAACGQDSGLRLLGGTATNSSGVPETDQFGELLPGEAVPLKELGIGQYGGEVVVFVEAVRVGHAVGASIRAVVGGGPSETAAATDSVKVTSIESSLVTFDPDSGETVAAGPELHAQNPRPEVVIRLESPVFQPDGSLGVVLHWSVRDHLSSLIADPAQRVQSLEIRCNGMALAVIQDLPSLSPGSGQMPFQPFRLQAEGQVAVTIPRGFDGSHPDQEFTWGGRVLKFSAESSPNALGNRGWDTEVLSVSWRLLEPGEAFDARDAIIAPAIGTRPARTFVPQIDPIAHSPRDSGESEFTPLAARLEGLEEACQAELALAQSGTEQPLNTFVFSPPRQYPVVVTFEGRPRILLITADELPPGLRTIRPDNVQRVANNGVLEYVLVSQDGAAQFPVIEAGYVDDPEFGGRERLFIEGEQEVLTHVDLLQAYEVLFGAEGRTLLMAFLAGGNEIALVDLWWPHGDRFDVDYFGSSNSWITIQIDEDLSPTRAADFLRMALEQTLGYSVVHNQLELTAPGGLELWEASWDARVREAAEKTALLAELHLSVLTSLNAGAEFVMDVTDIYQAAGIALDSDESTLLRGVATASIGTTLLPAALKVLWDRVPIPGRALRIVVRRGTTVRELLKLDGEVLDALCAAARAGDRAEAWQILRDGLSLADRINLANRGVVIKAATKHSGLRRAMLAFDTASLPPVILPSGTAFPPPVRPANLSDYHAHHMLQWFRKDWFAAHGLDVNDPRFGRWVAHARHSSNHYEFNTEWGNFIDREHIKGTLNSAGEREYTQEQILEFALELNDRLMY